MDLAPSRTFYLWKVHLPAVKLLLQDQLCHAASNLRQRLEHELKQEEEVRMERSRLFFFGVGGGSVRILQVASRCDFVTS